VAIRPALPSALGPRYSGNAESNRRT